MQIGTLFSWRLKIAGSTHISLKRNPIPVATRQDGVVDHQDGEEEVDHITNQTIPEDAVTQEVSLDLVMKIVINFFD